MHSFFGVQKLRALIYVHALGDLGDCEPTPVAAGVRVWNTEPAWPKTVDSICKRSISTLCEMHNPLVRWRWEEKEGPKRLLIVAASVTTQNWLT
jgi:hypothetical protein